MSFPPREAVFGSQSERYDQENFWGRVFKFVHLVDPRTLAPSVFFGLGRADARQELEHFASSNPGELTPGQSSKLWLAHKIVHSAHHPDTGDEIPPPFRMSGFVPFGTPIVVGMLLAQGPLQNAMWQWANQSHNALINYYNGNKSGQGASLQAAGKSFAIATTSAVGICLAGEQIVSRLRAPLVGRFVPFFAVATANLINISAMRQHELYDGIAVLSSSGEKLGVSVEAAKKALAETAISRVVLPIPILVGSPLLLIACEKAFPKLLQKPAVRIAAQTSICSIMFAIGLPFSLALFKSMGEIPKEELEPAIRQKMQSTDRFAYYNKGL